MKRTKIEWVRNLDGSQGYTINPVKGLCPVACEYCYARRLYKRFKWNPEIRYVPEVWADRIPDGSKVFVGSTFELFLDSLPNTWMEFTLTNIKLNPQTTYIFLTKQPQNLIKWSPFPENCWVGISVTNHKSLIKAQFHLAKIEAKVKFVSVEPFLPELETLSEGYWLGLFEVAEWGIFGSQTQPTRHPKLEAVKLAIDCADYNHRPVFVKEPLSSHYGINRKEYPR